MLHPLPFRKDAAQQISIGADMGLVHRLSVRIRDERITVMVTICSRSSELVHEHGTGSTAFSLYHVPQLTPAQTSKLVWISLTISMM